MAFGDLIDAFIEPFAPRAARRRAAERQALRAIRQYDAAVNDRRTSGWRRSASSSDREIWSGLAGLRNGARELVRNNKVAAAALRQIVANLVGDGIEARAMHADPKVAADAQAAWVSWAHGKVDGRNDFFGVQKLAVRSMIEAGESLILWAPDAAGPDGTCRVLEGDYLDHLRNNDLIGDRVTGGGRIVQGVQYDANGVRDAYWLFDRHPGDLWGTSRLARAYPAADVDHIFEELRPGQTRGVSWFAPVAMTLRDLGDFEDAVLMKKKVEACLALILTPPEGGSGSPLAQAEAQADPAKPSMETVSPGMIFRAAPGETATTLNPSSVGDGVDFMRLQLAEVAANLAPYHLITGDVSQANYSSLRAALLGFWANLDDWQQNVILPFCCAPAFSRRMRRLALETGDRRFLEVRAAWAPPVRRFVDPVKDVAGELAEVRAGFKTMAQSLSERGRNWKDHLAEIGEVNAAADGVGLALESDPRRVTGRGVLQVAAGYLVPKP